MVSAEAVRNIVGVIGNVISFGLFLAPSLTFVTILKKKSVEEFHPYPYLAAALNCAFWVLYGLPMVRPNSILVVTINGVGLMLELIYLSIFFAFASRDGRFKVAAILLIEVVFVGSLAVGVILGLHTHENRSLMVGVVADICNIIMYASPLTIVWKVIETKSVKYMPGFLCLAGFLNGSIWLAYALIKFDIYLLVSNGLGALFGLIQLIIYAFYYYYYKDMARTNVNVDSEDTSKLHRLEITGRNVV